MLENYTDGKILDLCDEYGVKALKWRQRFIGLLPEVFRRRLYKKAGCCSIFEFAQKKAGISEDQVRRVLNLSERFEDKPVLAAMLVNGEVSVNKLARVASVATIENQEYWAGQVLTLSKKSLEVLVHDERDIVKNLKKYKSVPGHGLHDIATSLSLSENSESYQSNMLQRLELSEKIINRLLALKRNGHDLNEILEKLLYHRETEIALEKQVLANKYDQKLEAGRVESPGDYNGVTRYIPAAVKSVLGAEFGTKCAVANCNKNSEVIHHTARFGVSQSHNPYFLAPLCKAHHDIAHTVDRRVLTAKSGYKRDYGP